MYLFFSVNESRRFCGVALMASPVDPRASLPDWLPSETHRWKGSFAVQVKAFVRMRVCAGFAVPSLYKTPIDFLTH